MSLHRCDAKLPLCPKCGKLMQLVSTMYLEYKDSVQEIAEPYWKCDWCKTELGHETT